MDPTEREAFREQLRLTCAVGPASTPYRALNWSLALVIAGVLLTGCSRIEDRRTGSGVCPLHHTNMQTEVVYSCKARLNFRRDYYEARKALFPNAGVEYGPHFYGEERFKIYVCPACEQARKEYLEKRDAR